jgi:hypothetical protein
MALPSDPDYISAATDPMVLASPAYLEMLRLKTDPYALHSRNEVLIKAIEEGLGR